MYKKESLELLRQRVDLAEVLQPHIKLQRAGSAYKALCPFHEEKTPSFVVQKGDTHYHCFGCGAHGDAIAFLMSYVKMGFVESIEALAERFQVPLEKEDAPEEKKGPSKTDLKNALEKAANFYHFALLHSEEGRVPLEYLYERGIDLSFIRQFQIGFAPSHGDLLHMLLRKESIPDVILEEAGLLSSARKRDFFIDRITFPIRDATGSVIGFSARKFKEETFGGKYINTPETPLFKKSQILFGLSYGRTRIAKERKAIIVEGQIDALRLIHLGFNHTVAGQGTAFGEGHVRELLHLGVNHVYLALDGDNAGQEAASKIGHLFQKKGVEVSFVALPLNYDPDSFLRERGPEAFSSLLEKGVDYLTFLFRHLAKNSNELSPSKKNELVETMVARIKEWEHPVMVHESLRKLAQLAEIPEGMISTQGIIAAPAAVKKKTSLQFGEIDADRILEGDVLRWLLLMGETNPRMVEIASLNLSQEHFRVQVAKSFYSLYMEACTQNKPRDLLAIGTSFNGPDSQQFLSEIMQKRVNLQKAEEGLIEAIHKIILRNWMEKREEIKTKIQSGKLSDEEALHLAKQFDEIRKQIPEVNLS